MAKTFYYGNAYYPEAWERSKIKEDIDKMQEIGFNTVRVAEFAWAEMEKSEGNYDFSLFREVVDYCKQKGMYVIMCTPTACPPLWLVEKDPNVLITNEHGKKLTHGARRNTCSSNATYLKACDAIVRKMGEEFGKDENVIGWQIDNEIYVAHGGVGCTCPDCRKGYHDFLKRKYGTIEKLNDEWDCHVWSLHYDRFDQVMPPDPAVWTHPSAKSVWAEYENELITGFVHRQIDILNEYVSVPVSTDMMPILGLSYDDVNAKTGVVQYNHYNNENDLFVVGMWSDYMRAQKDGAYWITETSPNWNGSEYANYSRPMEFSAANTMLPVALGAEMTCYWLWKTHYGGHEIMHGAVIDSWGRECHNVSEIRRMASELKTLGAFLDGSPVQKSKVAVHLTHSAWQIFGTQSIVPEFNYRDAMENWIYRPLSKAQIRADFIGASHSLDGYKMLISPFTVCLDEHGIAQKAIEFVENGGTWVVLPLTDMRTLSGAKYRNAPLGHLEDWTNVRLDFMLPKGDTYDVTLANGEKMRAENCVYYALKAGKNAQTLATYTQGYLQGYSAITSTKIGNGQIIMVGVVPQGDDWGKFVGGILDELGVTRDKASENLVFVRRSGKEEGFAVVETENRDGEWVAPYNATDLLTGESYQQGQTVAIKKYGYVFAKKA